VLVDDDEKQEEDHEKQEEDDKKQDDDEERLEDDDNKQENDQVLRDKVFSSRLRSPKCYKGYSLILWNKFQDFPKWSKLKIIWAEG